MRLSVDKNDPGYCADAFGTKVFFNGVELDDCITADEEQGVAICYVRDDDGLYEIDHQNNCIKRKTLNGIVKITPPEGLLNRIRRSG